LQEDLWEGLGDPDRLRRRCGSSCTASTRHCTDSPPPRYPDLTGTLGITPLSVCGLWSRNLVRCLPSKRDTVGGIQIFVYLRPYLFRIVHIFWTARGCVDKLVSMVRSGPRWCFGITPVVLRIHTLPCRTCIGRTAGRCCRNSVSDRERSMETNLIYAFVGGIRTYPHLLESRNTA